MTLTRSPARAAGTPPAVPGGAAAVPVVSAAYFAAVSSSNMFAPALAALSATFAVSTGAAGQMGAIAPLSWAILAPLVGPWSDRHGRRPLIVGGLVLMGAGTAIAALAPTVWALAVSRLLTGLGGACFGPSVYALVADMLPPARRAPALGIVMAGISAAALLGLPGIAYVTGVWGWRWAFGGLAVILLALAAASQLACPLTRSAAAKGTATAGLRALRRTPATMAALAGNALHQASFAAVSTYTAAFLVEHYRLPLQAAAAYLAAIAAGSVAGSLAGGRAARRRPAAIPVVACAITALAAPAFLAGVLPLLLATAVAALNAFAQSFRLPAHLTQVSEAAAETRGALLGLNATSNQTGYTGGAVVGGALLGTFGYPAVGLLAGALSAAACAIYAAVAARARATAKPARR